MSSEKFIGIGKKSLFYILLSSTLVTTLFTISSFFFDYREEMAGLDSVKQQIQQSSLAPLSASLWDFNTSQIDTHLNSFLALPDIMEVEITASDGKVLNSLKKQTIEKPANESVASTRNKLLRWEFDLIHEKNDQTKETIGQLNLYVSDGNIFLRLFHKAIRFFILQGFKTLITSTIILIILRLTITRHLTAITNHLEKLRAAQFSSKQEIQLKRKDRNPDEFSILVSVINQMAEASYQQHLSMSTQIREEKERAQQSARMAALGEMAAGIAHEINNPLGIIHGNVALLERSKIEIPESNREEFNKRLSIIQKMVLRITTIVKGLRTFTRDGSGDPFEPVDLKQLIEDSLIFCRQKFDREKVNFIQSTIPDGLIINCRASQVSQVLINLLNNAIDAVEPLAEKWVKLDVYDLPDQVKIAITDSGAGIPLEIQKKLAQPFFTTKPIGKGTGLGLSISMGIVKSHGGELQVNNQVKNTCFEFTLSKNPQQSVDANTDSTTGQKKVA